MRFTNTVQTLVERQGTGALSQERDLTHSSRLLLAGIAALTCEIGGRLLPVHRIARYALDAVVAGVVYQKRHLSHQEAELFRNRPSWLAPKQELETQLKVLGEKHPTFQHEVNRRLNKHEMRRLGLVLTAYTHWQQAEQSLKWFDQKTLPPALSDNWVAVIAQAHAGVARSWVKNPQQKIRGCIEYRLPKVAADQLCFKEAKDPVAYWNHYHKNGDKIKGEPTNEQVEACKLFYQNKERQRAAGMVKSVETYVELAEAFSSLGKLLEDGCRDPAQVAIPRLRQLIWSIHQRRQSLQEDKAFDSERKRGFASIPVLSTDEQMVRAQLARAKTSKDVCACLFPPTRRGG